MRDPAFWWTEHSTVAALLAPAGACYGAVAARRMARPGWRAPVPVVCVGNFTVGGAGKTPTAIALAQLLLRLGRRPFFLSRGYGGRVAGPVRVDLRALSREPCPGPCSRTGEDKEREGSQHPLTDVDVGDEPLLLARIAPTIVARDRPAGLKAATAAGADTIVMDDGLQNPSVKKDLALAVVDGRRGVGNGHIFPAGPLRAPLAVQLDHVDAVLVVGEEGRAAEVAVAAAARRGLPVFQSHLQPVPEAVAALAGKPVLAFAGIADPGKFFATLEAHGISIAVRRPFPDHHRYAEHEMAGLVASAERHGLTLVTTEKDIARLRGDPAAAKLIARSAVLPVILTFRDVTGIEAMLRGALWTGAA